MARRFDSRLLRTAILVLFAALAAGAGGCPLTRVKIKAPLDGALIDDPGPVFSRVRTGKNFQPLSIVVRLDGVDLIAALGLTPPFTGAGGIVSIGGDTVTIADFDYDISESAFNQVEFTADGLSDGDHLLEAEALKTDESLEMRTSAFALVDPFTLELSSLPAAGLPRGEASAGAEGVLVNASLGDSSASPPVVLSNGDELRAGFVNAAEGRISGAP